MMNCENEIEIALKILDSSIESPHKLLEFYSECQKSLEKLDEKCNENLFQTANNLLKNLDGSNWLDEEKLKQILLVLEKRKYLRAIDLLIECLFSESIKSKEDFVELLGQYKTKKSVPALFHTIETDKSNDEEGGFLRAKSISALLPIADERSVRFVSNYLTDISWRVRNAAAKLLLEHGNRETSNLFIDRLSIEDDPVNLDLLLNGIIKWKRKDAIPLLKKMLKDGDFSENEDMSLSVEDAVKQLEML